jgi:hypothetical protein
MKRNEIAIDANPSANPKLENTKKKVERDAKVVETVNNAPQENIPRS